MGNKESKDCILPNYSIELPDSAEYYTMSPNNKYLVAGYGCNNIILYDFENKQVLKDFEGCCWSKMSNRSINVSFSPDSQLIAYRWENMVRIMSTESFEKVKEFNHDGKWVWCQFSPDGTMLAVGG